MMNTNISKHFLYYSVIIVLPSSLAACFPYPHKETAVPEISISLTKNGLPVNGVEVYVSDTAPQSDYVCKTPLYVGTTQANGHILIAPIRNWSFFYDYLNDFSSLGKYQTHETDLCFKVDDKYVYGDTVDSRLDIVEKISITCNLDKYPDVIFGSKDKPHELKEIMDKLICGEQRS